MPPSGPARRRCRRSRLRHQRKALLFGSAVLSRFGGPGCAGSGSTSPYSAGPAVNDSWPPDRIFNGLVMMRRLGQRVVRAQGLDQPGMNDLGILAELRLEDGDAHEAAAKWIETGASRVACAFLVYMPPPVPRCSGWA